MSWRVGFSTSSYFLFKAAVWQVVGSAQAHLVLSHFADSLGRLLLPTPGRRFCCCRCSRRVSRQASVPCVGDPCSSSGFFMTVLFVTVTCDQ